MAFRTGSRHGHRTCFSEGFDPSDSATDVPADGERLRRTECGAPIRDEPEHFPSDASGAARSAKPQRMPSATPFGDIALKAKIADLSTRLAEAEEALRSAASAEVSSKPDTEPTKLLEAERTLAMERNLLRTLVDIVPDHIFVRDRAYRHLLNNRAQLAMLRVKKPRGHAGKDRLRLLSAGARASTSTRTTSG